MAMGPELKMMVDWDEVRSAFVDAKANRVKDPDGYAAAKAAMSKMRIYWRQIDEMVGVRSRGGPGVAVTKPIGISAAVKDTA